MSERVGDAVRCAKLIEDNLISGSEESTLEAWLDATS